MSKDQEDIVSASSFTEVLVGSFSLATAEILDSNITNLTLSLSATQITMVKKDVATSCMRIFQVGSVFCPACLFDIVHMH